MIIGKLNLTEPEVEQIYRIILARKAANEIKEFNYFEGIISDENSLYLKELCQFDFNVKPSKESEEWIGAHSWSLAVSTLADLELNIFGVHYHIGVADYSMKYAEKYSIEDRMRKWSDIRQKFLRETDELLEL